MTLRALTDCLTKEFVPSVRGLQSSLSRPWRELSDDMPSELQVR